MASCLEAESDGDVGVEVAQRADRSENDPPLSATCSRLGWLDSWDHRIHSEVPGKAMTWLFSPPTRQSPHPRRDQFHRIPGRVTKVNGSTPSWPLDLFFDGDGVAVQVLPPGVEGFCFNSQGEMAWPGGSMRRQLVALEGGFGQESK
jgi:hypothetical protein